ncbi:MAG: LamG-like jellyroll fold domain-containing protein [Planctomycetota bacterium]|jgi:hypothetical protein
MHVINPTLPALATVALLAAPGLAIDDYVCYWSFDEGTGVVLHDASANAFDGAISGATWAPGISGTALSFDGIDDIVEITDGGGFPDLVGELTEGTISVWFRFDTMPEPNEIYPFFYAGNALPGWDHSEVIIEVGHFTTQSRLYYTTMIGGNIPQCFDSDFDLPVDTWHHFAAVVGPDYNTGYLNGQEMVARDYNFGGPEDHYFFADVPDESVCWIGRGFLSHQTQDQFADAVVDEIRIYDRPLSAQEIQQYYESVLSTPGDLDGDGSVSTSDLLIMLGAWGPCPDPPDPCPADLNGDGLVGTGDLLMLLANWG